MSEADRYGEGSFGEGSFKGSFEWTMMRLGDYTLSTHNEDDFWLQNGDGEGMTVSNVEFEKILDDYFKENF